MKPKRTLLLCTLVVLVLSSQAAKLEPRLAPTSLVAPGTPSSRAIELGEERFGSRIAIPVLLRGPGPALDRQGPRLARAMRKVPDAVVLSAWDRVQPKIPLRPSKREGLVVAFVERAPEDALDVAENVEKLVHRTVDAPLDAHVTGQAPIAKATKDANFDAARSAERLVLPVLALVLLAVFRSPVAAVIPGLCGMATLVGGTGALSLLSLAMPIQPVAVSVASMLGLALGIDYALLMVFRFREELADGRSPHDSALGALASAGRTVTFAGVVLLAGNVLALAIMPGELLLSVIVGIIVVIALSVLVAVLMMPALLALLGENVNRWTIRIGGADARPGGFFEGLSSRARRRPGLAAAGILTVLLAATVPALKLDPVPPGVSELPDDDQASRDYRQVSRSLGPGWGGPFELVAVAQSGTVLERSRLRGFARLERRVAEDPAVAHVAGPGDLLTPRPPAQARARGGADRGEVAAGGGIPTLAALDSAPPGRRRLAELAVNLDRGATAGRVLVIPTTATQAKETERLARRLGDEAERFSGAAGLKAEVGGEAGIVTDYDRLISGRLPLLIFSIAAVHLLILIPVFRSIVLALVAILLNLLTLGAAFGVMSLLFEGSDPIAGGPGDLFLLPTLGIFTVVSGLSVDYVVFIVTRMREGWLQGVSPDEAIDYGVHHTARVVAGAAAIMTAVFLAFAATGFHAIRQLGVGLAFAVALDATVIRLLLLPCLMQVFGKWCWWLPAWLDRRLPFADRPVVAPRVEGVSQPT